MAFTTDNTTGFSADELDTLNTALEELKAQYPAVDEKNLHDLLNDHWIDGATAAELVARVQLDIR